MRNAAETARPSGCPGNAYRAMAFPTGSTAQSAAVTEHLQHKSAARRNVSGHSEHACSRKAL